MLTADRYWDLWTALMNTIMSVLEISWLPAVIT